MSVLPGNVPDALLLDEMFSPAIATDLAARGIDCRAVVTDPVLRALSDLEIFQAALTEGRVLVTNNIPDFESLRRAHEAAGNKVPGLIYTSDLTFPRTKAYMSRLAAALADAATGRETERRGGVLWLRPPRDSLKRLEVLFEQRVAKTMDWFQGSSRIFISRRRAIASARRHDGCHNDMRNDEMAVIPRWQRLTTVRPGR